MICSVTLTLLRPDSEPLAGITVSAFVRGTGVPVDAVTDASGEAQFTLESGSVVRFVCEQSIELNGNTVEIPNTSNFNVGTFTADAASEGDPGGDSLEKATGAEVDTGTDDEKYITPKALEDSDYIKEADLPPSSGTNIFSDVLSGGLPDDGVGSTGDYFFDFSFPQILYGPKPISGLWSDANSTAFSSATGTINSVTPGYGINIDNANPQSPIINVETGLFVESVEAGSGISVDDTDPANPIVSVEPGGVLQVWSSLFDFNGASEQNLMQAVPARHVRVITACHIRGGDLSSMDGALTVGWDNNNYGDLVSTGGSGVDVLGVRGISYFTSNGDTFPIGTAGDIFKAFYGGSSFNVQALIEILYYDQAV